MGDLSPCWGWGERLKSRTPSKLTFLCYSFLEVYTLTTNDKTAFVVMRRRELTFLLSFNQEKISTVSADGPRQTEVEKRLSGFGDVTRGGNIVRASREFRGRRLRSIEVER